MSGRDRRPYLTATTLDQALLNACADNLDCKLEAVVEIEKPTPPGGTIYASDRNKYVGGTFYEALLKMPIITRTVGDWLVSELQFSTQQLELSNVDGRFNEFLPGGANYSGWVGKSISMRVGLAEVASSYKTLFSGSVTDAGGFKRGVKSIIFIARDSNDRFNQKFPGETFVEANYPKIEPKNIGKVVPIIYGDYTTRTEPAPASIPALIVNGNDPLVTFKEKPIVSITAPASPAVLTVVDHDFDVNDPVQLTTSGTLPSPFGTGTTYYVKTVVGQDDITLSLTPGGAVINSVLAGSGEHRIIADPTATHRSVQGVVASHDLLSLPTNQVYLKRGDTYYNVPSADVVVGAGNKSITVAQNTVTLWVEGAAYLFEASDTFWVKVVGKGLAGFENNLIWQARDILLMFGNAVSGDLHSNWVTYRDKVTPTQSATADISSRVWIGEQQQALQYALSMLEQVRLEAFIDRDQKLKINSLHFEDWNASPSFTVRNWDVERGTFQASIDNKNNFNAARAVFNLLPDINEEAYATAVWKNDAAITQAGKRITKEIAFPNLYIQSEVEDQLVEILRLASATLEGLQVNLTWRALLVDIGDFILVNVAIGSTIYENVPAMVRSVGIDPDGFKIPLSAWLLTLVPFPGYTPGYAGTVGGYSATIDQDA